MKAANEVDFVALDYNPYSILAYANSIEDIITDKFLKIHNVGWRVNRFDVFNGSLYAG